MYQTTIIVEKSRQARRIFEKSKGNNVKREQRVLKIILNAYENLDYFGRDVARNTFFGNSKPLYEQPEIYQGLNTITYQK